MDDQRKFVRGERMIVGSPDGQSVGMAAQGDLVAARLAAIEQRQAEIERKLDNLTEYVRSLMTPSQQLRCTRPDR